MKRVNSHLNGGNLYVYKYTGNLPKIKITIQNDIYMYIIGGGGNKTMCCLASFHRVSGAWGLSNFGNTDFTVTFDKDTGVILFGDTPPYFSAFIVADAKINPVSSN